MNQTKDMQTPTSMVQTMNLDFNTIAEEIFLANKAKGFDKTDGNVAEGLMLISSEAHEALEAHRSDRFADVEAFNSRFSNLLNIVRSPAESNEAFIQIFEQEIKDTYEDEIADTLIRVFDWAGRRGIDLNFHVKKKLEYNKTRPYKHGNKKY